MTFDQFTQWLRRGRTPIYTYPYRIEPCLCRDINCHGWRLREVEIKPLQRLPDAMIRPEATYPSPQPDH